jgi:hypothetical protein
MALLNASGLELHMTKEKALRLLKALDGKDQETAHMEADEILLQIIDDREIREAYEAIEKWYA